MSEWSRFNSQFRETEWERQQRWKATRAKRTAEGKCWQCAKTFMDCTCPNLRHSPQTNPIKQEKENE